MVDTTFQSIATKELEVSKLWYGGTKQGDETAADITFAVSGTTTTMTIGRLSASGGNNVTIFRSKGNAGGVYMYNGGAQIKMSDSVTPSSVTGEAVLQIDSVTKGVLLPRMTTTQANTLSGSLAAATPGTVSGMLIFNTVLNKLEVWNGAQWETVTSVAR